MYIETVSVFIHFFSSVGTLLADEMSISEAIALDQRSMEIQGFVDLGQYTPENQLSTRADHVLVLMFQPLRGSWIQV